MRIIRTKNYEEMSRKVLMIVSGKDTAEILKKAFSGPASPQVPASFLQTTRTSYWLQTRMR